MKKVYNDLTIINLYFKTSYRKLFNILDKTGSWKSISGKYQFIRQLLYVNTCFNMSKTILILDFHL